MTIATKRPAISLFAVALAFASTAFSESNAQSSEHDLILEDGVFRQGAHRLAIDDWGTMHLLAGDKPIIDGINLEGIHEGNSWSVGLGSPLIVHRDENGFRMEASSPGGDRSYLMTVTQDGDSLVLRAERQGALPTDDCEDFLRFALPHPIYRDSQFYTERITLFYDDRTFDESMIIDGFMEFHAHTEDFTLNFILETDEQIMRIDDPWQERRPAYRLDVRLPAGEEAHVEVRMSLPPSSGDLMAPAIRFPSVGYRLDGPKRAVVEWFKFTDRPEDTVKVVGVDGTVVLEATLGESVTFLGKNYAEFGFSELDERGVYRFVWSGGETDFFVVREDVLPDSLWTPTLDRFLPWQMSHAEVDFGPALPPKRKAFMDDGVRAPANVPPVGGFISHGQQGSLYDALEVMPANIGGWFDGGVTHQNVPAHAYAVWILSLAHEEFRINRDTATYQMSEQKYSTTGGDGSPDIVAQIEWGVWWLLQMQEPTGRVYTGVASRPERDTVLMIPERTTDGEAGTEDERYVFVDYHPHVQLAQVIALSSASRLIDRANPALGRRALNSAREAFDYFKNQPETYRPTVNFPYNDEDPAVARGRDGMLLAAIAELYILTQDPEYLELLDTMKDDIDRIGFEAPAPRWSRDSGFWYAGPSLARLHGQLPDGEVRDAVEELLARAAEAKKAALSQRPWPFSAEDMGTRGVNGVAAAHVFDTYWLSQVHPDIISMDDALPAFEWIVGMNPVSGLTFVPGVGYQAPSYLFNSNIHGRVRNFKATVPGAMMPGVSRLSGNDLLVYGDLPMRRQHHEARTADQAAWIFAVHALRPSGD